MSKVMTLSEAIRTFIHDGDCVYAAGFTHLIPFAAAHEIIRQRKRDLVLARATPDLIYDAMVAAAALASSSSRGEAIPAWACSARSAPPSSPAS